MQSLCSPTFLLSSWTLLASTWIVFIRESGCSRTKIKHFIKHFFPDKAGWPWHGHIWMSCWFKYSHSWIILDKSSRMIQCLIEECVKGMLSPKSHQKLYPEPCCVPLFQRTISEPVPVPHTYNWSPSHTQYVWTTGLYCPAWHRLSAIVIKNIIIIIIIVSYVFA